MKSAKTTKVAFNSIKFPELPKLLNKKHRIQYKNIEELKKSLRQDVRQQIKEHNENISQYKSERCILD